MAALLGWSAAGRAFGQQVHFGPSLGTSSMIGVVIGADFADAGGGFGVRLVGGVLPLLGLSFEFGADAYYRFGPPGSGPYVGAGLGYGQLAIATDYYRDVFLHAHALLGYDLALGSRVSLFAEVMPGLGLSLSGINAGQPFFWPGFGLGLKLLF